MSVLPIRGSILSVLVAVALGASPLSAQEGTTPGEGWRIGVAGGVGVALSGHDLTEGGDTGGLLRMSAAPPLGDRRLGLELDWISTWISRGVGEDRRHHLGANLTYRPFAPALRLRVGGGVGLVTDVEASFPPPGTIGDGVVATGAVSSLDGTVGLSFDVPVSGAFALGPVADLLIQRAAGRTFTTFVAAVRLTFDAGS